MPQIKLAESRTESTPKIGRSRIPPVGNGYEVELFAQMGSQHAIAKHRPPGSAVEPLRAIQLLAGRNPTAFDSFSHVDRPNAAHKPCALDPRPSGFECAKGQFVIAAVVIAAELKVACKYDDDWVAKHIGGFLVVAIRQSAGCWRGSPLSLICFVAAASALNEVTFSGMIATHTGWGVSSHIKEDRQWEAYRDMGHLPSSFHLSFWRIGPWPLKPMGALAEIPTERMVNHLTSFSFQLPPQLNFPRPEEAS